MKTLDKGRPYGEVYGGAPAMFEQDGTLFDSRCREIGADWQPAAPVVTVEPPPEEKAGPSPDEEKAGPSPDEVVAMAKAGKTPVEIGRTLGVHVAKVKAIIKRAL